MIREVWAVKRSGEQFPCEAAISEVDVPYGRPRKFTVVIRDITERKRAEGALAHRAEELSRSNAELEEFAYVASHDLQEPLRKIQSFGERLQAMAVRESLGEQSCDYLKRMMNASARMQNLINGLLSYSRVNSRGQTFVSVDLSEVAGQVLSDLEVSINQVNGRVDVGNLPTIEADPLQMRQLFQNLVANALKFRRDGEPPVVSLQSKLLSAAEGGARCSQVDRFCRITVQDNGIGFDEKYLDRIFTVFQRLHGRDEYEGTGIGLAVCRKIAQRHGGDITAKSEPGEGATFIVTLPIEQTKAEDMP